MMGYWINLEEDGETVQVENHSEGGTYVLGGTNDAEMSLTWNYCKYYYDLIDGEKGIKWINEKKAGDTIQKLQEAVEKLGDNPSDDYWEATEGNAGHALSTLLSWATQHPKGVWRIS